MSIMPSFEARPVEAMLIGRMLAGYGELEFAFASCLKNVLNDHDTAIKAYFRLRSESSRLEMADALLRPAYKRIEMEGIYAQAYGAIRACLKIRNRYAHSHWGTDDTPGLFFTNIQDAADAADGLELEILHVDLDILAAQEDFFKYTLHCLQFLEAEASRKTGWKEAHPFLMPQARVPPTPHNPPSQHIPQWLGEDQKRQHLERALAREAAVRSPQQK